MSKIIVNKQDKKSTINKNIYGNFSSTWAAASTTASMWERIPPSPTSTACAPTWWKPCGTSSCLCSAGRRLLRR